MHTGGFDESNCVNDARGANRKCVAILRVVFILNFGVISLKGFCNWCARALFRDRMKDIKLHLTCIWATAIEYLFKQWIFVPFLCIRGGGVGYAGNQRCGSKSYLSWKFYWRVSGAVFCYMLQTHVKACVLWLIKMATHIRIYFIWVVSVLDISTINYQ